MDPLVTASVRNFGNVNPIYVEIIIIFLETIRDPIIDPINSTNSEAKKRLVKAMKFQHFKDQTVSQIM